MLLSKQTTTVSHDTIKTLVCELVSHYHQSTARSCTEQHWQSANGKSRVLIYGHSLALSSVLHQAVNAVHCEYVLLFEQQHVFTWSEHRWPQLVHRDDAINTDELLEIDSECLADLLSYHTMAETQWHKQYCTGLKCECAA